MYSGHIVKLYATPCEIPAVCVCVCTCGVNLWRMSELVEKNELMLLWIKNKKKFFHESENGIESKSGGKMPLKNWQPVKLDYTFSICRSFLISIKIKLTFDFGFCFLILFQIASYSCVSVCFCFGILSAKWRLVGMNVRAWASQTFDDCHLHFKVSMSNHKMEIW